jgi:FdhE protein
MHFQKSGRTLAAALHVQHPEWRPLLILIEAALSEAERPRWTRFVPPLRRSRGEGQPLLDGTVISVAPKLVERWVRHLLALAVAAGTEVQPLANAIAAGRLDPSLLFATAVSRDVDRFHEVARVESDYRGILRGLASLMAMPMLHACRQAWAEDVPTDWAYGYCPVCGGWPVLAELRGLDGSRHLRCGCCGGDWRTEWLRCPFCGERNHDKLGSLVSPDDVLERQSIEVCDSCSGYLKTITTLTAIPPEDVQLHDLATLALDIAVLERDYRRPGVKGCALGVDVVAEPWRLRDLLSLRP